METREPVGKNQGRFCITKVSEKDGKGNLLRVYFEVATNEGTRIKICHTLDEAQNKLDALAENERKEQS